MLRLEYHDLLGLFEMLDDGDGEIAIDELLGRSPGNCTLFRVRLPAPLLATQHQTVQSFGHLQQYFGHRTLESSAQVQKPCWCPGANRHSSSCRRTVHTRHEKS